MWISRMFEITPAKQSVYNKYVDITTEPHQPCNTYTWFSFSDFKKVKGTVVTPSEPRTHAGIYWGYTVRLAGSLGAVFTDCPYKENYDLTIGTSERGTSIDEFEPEDPYYK